MESAFDHEICKDLHSCFEDIRYIQRHMHKNRGTPNEFKLASELHETKVKLHRVLEEIYAMNAFTRKPGEYLPGKLVNMEIQRKIWQKMDDMKPPLDILRDPNATREEKDASLVKAKKVCDEMCEIWFQPLQEPAIFEPDPNSLITHCGFQACRPASQIPTLRVLRRAETSWDC
ncbi:hypothetical protein BGW36DRAFT_385598 [Talaromyces proteolyticus]|uniref:Uncharacterized protein n=1 Tax=Talaromyces proteolyticus TaxID=1131652 RepID=A0AAD4KJK9_9EURO|nr:uncharacterized protein BGW36DRAFT_385598 [Talaromyces proteolyticus]KAH8692960.1 hypothetical protein BGW36DRAFT_385598 [Talaromyces proteolyticus]